MDAVNSFVGTHLPKLPNQAGPVDGVKMDGSSVSTTNSGIRDAQGMGGWHPFGLGGSSDRGSAGTSYNTQLDAAVGSIDTQLKTLNNLKGTSSYDQAAVDKLTKERGDWNIKRWQSANLSGSPVKDHIRAMLQSGQLSYADMAGMDISVLGDDAQLAQSLDSVLTAKRVQAVAPEPPPVDPTIAEQGAANKAIDDTMSATTDFVTGQMGDLKTFDQGVQGTENGEASAGASLARMAGGEAAGMAAGEAGANTAAQGAAQRDVLQQNQKTALESFLSDSLSKDIGDNSDLAKMDVAHRTEIQGHAADELLDNITKSIGNTQGAAQGQLNDLKAAIDDWKVSMADQELSKEKWMKIVKIAGGLAMTGAGAMSGNPLLVAGGAGTVINGATSG